PDVPVWRDGDQQHERGWLGRPLLASLDSLKRRAPSIPWKLRIYWTPQFLHGSFGVKKRQHHPLRDRILKNRYAPLQNAVRGQARLSRSPREGLRIPRLASQERTPLRNLR